MTYAAPPDRDTGLWTPAPLQRAWQRIRLVEMRWALGVVVALTGSAVVLVPPANAHADAVAYLVNVTVRPGYGFANADAALAYGNTLCDKVRSGSSYASVTSDVKRDFGNPDEYQASYLITQAANELCPGAIWQLRNSAVGYRPGSE